MPAEILPTQDAVIWQVQSIDAPLHIGALAVFEAGPLRDADGTIRIDDIRRHASVQLEHTPRFRQRLLELPLAQGLAWVDDERFDIAHHVRLGSLPHPGGDAELREFVARHLEVPPDLTRPLWEIWVVDGLAGDRVAVLPKVNHVMADGMALLEFSLRLLDFEPQFHGEEPSPWTPEPVPDARSLLTSGMANRIGNQVGALWRVVATATNPKVLLGAAKAIGRLGHTGSGRAPGLPITRPVGPHRDFLWARLPWSDLDRVKRAEGTTLNDVILAVAAGALAHYLDHTGHDLGGRPPRVLVPVSTHGASAGDEVENRFSMLVADLPVATTDPLERLQSVHAEMERHKASAQTALGPMLFSLGDLLPSWLVRAAAPPALRNQPFVNLAVTNMPGSRDPMYLLGAEMTELYPYICGVGNVAVIMGIISYRDTLGVGITVDADAVPDPDLLVAGLEQAAEELIQASATTR